VAALVVVASLAITIKLYRQYALAPYRVAVTSVGPYAERSVTISFQVHKPAGVATVCTVRARSRDGVEVGRAEVVAGTPDQTTVIVTYTLATTGRAILADVPGCGPAH
jgi:Domain of unknown function (DUF4307)